MRIFEKKFITFTTCLIMFCYSFGVFLLKNFYNTSFNDVVVFGENFLNKNFFMPSLLSLIVFISGMLILLILPGWIFAANFASLKKNISTFAGTSFFITIFIHIFETSFLKIVVKRSLDRELILFAITITIFFELLFLWHNNEEKKESQNNTKIHFDPAPYLVICLISMSFLFYSKNNFTTYKINKFNYTEQAVLNIPLGEQEDSLEIFGVALSLKSKLLPFWNLEYANKFGYFFTDPPLYSYLSMFFLLFFGHGDAAFYFPAFIFSVFPFIFIVSKCKRNKNIIAIFASIIMVSFLNISANDYIAFLHRGYFFSFLLIPMYEYLINKDYNLFLIFAGLLTLTKFYGIFFVFISFIGILIFYNERKNEIIQIFLKYLYFLFLLVFSISLIGFFNNNLEVYYRTFLVENFLRFDYFNLLSYLFPKYVVFHSTFNIKNVLNFIFWCLKSTAFCFPVLFLLGKDKRENFYAFVGISYFILILLSKYNFLRYVIPLIPIVSVIICSKMERWSYNGK